jgi:hypothetical protein
MEQFRRFLNEPTLREIHLCDRLFTWSNERLHPTLERIEHAFVSNEWEALHPHYYLQSLSSLCSDHAPLLLTLDIEFVACKHFHFRAIWLRFPSFLNVCQEGVELPTSQREPLRSTGLAPLAHCEGAKKLERSLYRVHLVAA